MAVYGSPFGKNVGKLPQVPVQKVEPTDEERKKKAQEDLLKAVDSAVNRIKIAPNMSADEKERAIKEVYRLAESGYPAGKEPSAPTSRLGKIWEATTSAVKGGLGRVIAPWAPNQKTAEAVYDYTLGGIQRGAMSAITELGDVAVKRGFSPFRPAAPFTPVVGGKGELRVAPKEQTLRDKLAQVETRTSGALTPKQKETFGAAYALSGEEQGASLKDLRSQFLNRKWNYGDSALAKAVAADNPMTGFATELGIAVVTDPQTYITGVGNVQYVGRAGKLALAQRFATKEMVARYPQLAGKFNEIVRYGQHANIAGFRDILKAEGIETGLRIMGKVAKGTDEIAAPIGRGMSASWEKVMDIATVSGNKLKGILSPKSRSFMMDVGRRSGGAYRLSEADAVKEVAKWSARQFGRGSVNSQYNRWSSAIRGIVEQVRSEGWADDASDLVERANPYSFKGGVKFSSLSTEQQKVVRGYIDWQNGIRSELSALRDEFARKYGVDVPELGNIDDYIYHKITPEAMAWINDTDAVTRGLFRTGDLDAADLTNVASPLQYRKLRAPQVLPDGTIKYETFMGEQIKEGTIREINEIFKRQSGTDIKFFHTDLGNIADGYAYSLAKAYGRVRYVSRLMEYGDSAAAKLLYKTVPDPVLRESTKKALDEAVEIRNGVRFALNRRLQSIGSVVRQSIKDAEDIVNGNLRQRKLNARQTDALLARVKKLEGDLEVLVKRGNELEAHARGEFDTVYAGLLAEISTMRRALESGNSELEEIRIGLQTTYRTMYPNAVRVPDDIDVLADRISAARGVPAAREVRAINARLGELRRQMDELGAGTPEYQQLADEVARLKDVDNGFRVMAEYRAAQDYAPDNGFLYITGREMAETDEMQIPFKAMRTNTNGFPDKNDVLAVRVYGNDEVLDFRTASGVSRLFGRNDFGDGLSEQLRMLGVDTQPLDDGLDMIRVGMPIDPELESMYPDVANVLKLMEGVTSQTIMPNGDPQLIKQIYEMYIESVTGLLVRTNVPNADYVARQVVDGALGYVAKVGVDTNTAKGIVVPASLFDETAEADDVVVLLAPKVVLAPTDSVTGSVQDASSPLVQALMRSDAESAMAASRAKLNELASRKAEVDDTTTALKAEMTQLQRRKGGLKSAATKRRNAAVSARERAGEVRNAPREIIINGKPKMMTLQEMDKNLNALTATEARLRSNMERTLAAETAALREGGLTRRGIEGRLADNTDRLRVLFNEANALYSWDAGTGMVVREEIAAAIDAIASMPPAGSSAEAARAWLAGVQRAVESSSLIKDPAIRNSYERLMQLSAFDEWNLANAEEALSFARGDYEAVTSGRIGAILDKAENRVFGGWEALADLGIQVPKDVLDVWKPNIQKILARQNRMALLKGVDYLNKVFKTYAIGTVGFVVRNLYSAVFMNGVAGVEAETMKQGWKAMQYYNEFGAARWLDELGIVGKERDMYKQALEAVEASGRRGFFSELAEPAVKGTRREKVLSAIVDNRYTRAIQRSNSRVEDAVRFPLALQTLKDGGDFSSAVQQVTRYHFDYTDMSDVDEFATKYIPFWIWTTRNLPNQLANQWMRPQAYSLWENFQESLPMDDNTMLPSWLRSYEPMSLARFGLPNVLLRPDMPHQRLTEGIRQFTEFDKLIGSLYPTLKLPIEIAANRQMGIDVGDFPEEAEKAVGIDLLLAKALQATPLGDKYAPVKRLGGGKTEQQITELPSYVVGNLVPLIAHLQRLAGGKLGGKQTYKDRQLSAIASNLGLPLSLVTERMEGSEALGREFGINDYMDMLKRLGMVQSASDVRTQAGLPRRIQERKNIERRAEERAWEAELSAKAKERAALRKASLNAIADRYGKNSEQYKALKEKFAQEDKITAQLERQAQVKQNPVIISEEGD